MSAEEILRSTEKRALGKNQEIISHVTGKGSQKGGIFKKFSATAFATLMILFQVKRLLEQNFGSLIIAGLQINKTEQTVRICRMEINILLLFDIQNLSQ